MYYVICTREFDKEVQEPDVLGCWELDKAVEVLNLHVEGQKPFEGQCVSQRILTISIVDQETWDG